MPGFGVELMPLFAQAEAFKPGFAALVGNPPFQGGQRITGALGTPYRDYLVTHLARGKSGSADLCAYFFLRGRDVLRQGGGVGLLATNTIAQGDTREVGLDQLTQAGFSIPRAVPSCKWPGKAKVIVAYVWLRRGKWQAGYLLDDKLVSGITSYLTVPGSAKGEPHRLFENKGRAFIGQYIMGTGFIVSPEDAQSLINKDLRNQDILFPFLNGEDLNSHPSHEPSRWVINFHNWSLEKAEQYFDCIDIVRQKVKPEREKQKDKFGKTYWWRFLRTRPELRDAINNTQNGNEQRLTSVFVQPSPSKYMMVVQVPADQVFAHPMVVFPVEKFTFFCVVSSTLHEIWARVRGSTLKTDLRYAPSDVFETFPFPDTRNPIPDTLSPIGEQYHEHRRQVMLARQEGLTKTYNRFHDPDESAEDIATLRRLHTEMDAAVAAAYGWHDLDLGHGFHATKQGTRYTISEAARREVLDRLLALNHERYAEEVAAGLHEKGKGKAKKGTGRKGKKGKGGDAEQGELL
jgi:hypothetical protein